MKGGGIWGGKSETKRGKKPGGVVGPVSSSRVEFGVEKGRGEDGQKKKQERENAQREGAAPQGPYLSALGREESETLGQRSQGRGRKRNGEVTSCRKEGSSSGRRSLLEYDK